MTKEILGYTSGLFAFLFYLGIMIGIARRQSQPSRSTWIIWSINDLLIFCSSLSLGAWNTLWAPLVYVISGFICMGLSIRYDSKPLSPIDRACLIGSTLAWMIWYLSNSAFTALSLGVTVNTIGAIPTWTKLYNDPNSEKLLPWIFVTISGLCQILSIERMIIELAFFPFNSFFLSSSILILCLRRYRYRVFYKKSL